MRCVTRTRYRGPPESATRPVGRNSPSRGSVRRTAVRRRRRTEVAAMTDEEAPRSPQRPVELILLRQLASYLDTPVFLVDARGDLLYFNEPAEPLLGLRFEEVGELSMADWLGAFRPGDEGGQVLSEGDVPLVAALQQQRPVHLALTIAGADGVRRGVEATLSSAPRTGRPPARCHRAFWRLSLIVDRRATSRATAGASVARGRAGRRPEATGRPPARSAHPGRAP